MPTTAIADFFCAIFVGIVFVRNMLEHNAFKSNRLLNLCLLLMFLILIDDAMAYIFIGPSYSLPFRYTINLLSFLGASLIALIYTLYLKDLLKEKGHSNQWIFRILIIIELAWLAATIYEFIAGHLLSYDGNGIENLNYSLPIYITVIQMVVLISLPVITIINNRYIGIRQTILMCLFNIVPIISSLLFTTLGADLSYSLSAVTLVLMTVFAQKTHVEDLEKEHDHQLRKEEEYKLLADNNARILALEDDFESLYDIDLESGHYDVFVKGDFYRDNVINHLADPKDYFAELRDNIDAVIYEEDREGLYNSLTRESIRRELSENEHFDYFYRVKTDNEPVWFKMRIVYKNEEKNDVIIGVFNAEKDVETQQLVEQKKLLELAREEADKANKSKSDFLFNMSHDIRTPMNAITGFTSMAKKYSYDQEKVNSFLDKINTSGHQLLSLVNQVLEMARIESGQIEMVEVPVNIRKEYDTMVTVLAEQAMSKSLKFKYDLDIQHNNVLADEARMNSITLNIVGNALKYTPEGGIIEFRLKEIPCSKEGYASYVFTVEDTGIGMSEEFQKNLFEPFAREQNSTVSRIQGTGLGMSIVKKFVDFLGGEITVHSELGKGTRFDITVDFRINEVEEEDVEMGREVGTASFRNLKVLLVEDNELNREIAKDVLEDEGFVVDDAEDGLQAVDALREKGPDFYDFVLMDIQMPFMNGYEATKEIRKMYPDSNIPIIALSANAFEEDRKEALEAGMDDHVAKPIEIVKLFGVLAKYLR